MTGEPRSRDELITVCGWGLHQVWQPGKDAVVKSIRFAFCLAVLGVLLVIIGLAKGMSGFLLSGPIECANQGPGSAPGQVTPVDPCLRRAGWDQGGYAFIAPGVLTLIGAASIRLTARR